MGTIETTTIEVRERSAPMSLHFDDADPVAGMPRGGMPLAWSRGFGQRRREGVDGAPERRPP